MARVGDGNALNPVNPLTLKTAKGGTPQLDKSLEKRRDMSWHDYLIALLHLGASLEHSLMVQYLYAAYSLGGDQVPPEYRPMVKHWQESILAVAREEMGHLLTVQNVLTFLGAGVNISRQNFPWEIEWFNLEPFTLGALACYVYAEMPEDEKFPERKQIEELAHKHLKSKSQKDIPELHPVGTVYSDIMKVLGDPGLIPDSAFHEETYVLQASWDDWGRGYKPDPRPLDPEGNLVTASAESVKAAQFRSHILIDRVATRTQALAALKALSIQGEGPHGTEKEDEWSHFKRFIKIFREYETIKNENWSPTLPVSVNPNTVDDPKAPDRDGYISSIRARNWADLFNLRYRMLLTFLMHTFQVARLTRSGEPNVRAMLMHKVFGEMYNLKTISGILVQLPLRDAVDPNTAPKDVPRAGPPFEMPYNLRLPVADVDCWCLHLDILGSVSDVYTAILKSDPRPEDRAYVETLMDLDEQTKTWINRILAGLNSTARYSA